MFIVRRFTSRQIYSLCATLVLSFVASVLIGEPIRKLNDASIFPPARWSSSTLKTSDSQSCPQFLSACDVIADDLAGAEDDLDFLPASSSPPIPEHEYIWTGHSLETDIRGNALGLRDRSPPVLS
jgi:hypothetical protein